MRFVSYFAFHLEIPRNGIANLDKKKNYLFILFFLSYGVSRTKTEVSSFFNFLWQHITLLSSLVFLFYYLHLFFFFFFFFLTTLPMFYYFSFSTFFVRSSAAFLLIRLADVFEFITGDDWFLISSTKHLGYRRVKKKKKQRRLRIRNFRDGIDHENPCKIIFDVNW